LFEIGLTFETKEKIVINQRALFLSLLLCGALAVFLSLPLPKGSSEMIIFINRMIFPLAFIAPVGYYFVLAGSDKRITYRHAMPICIIVIIVSVVIFGYKLSSSLDVSGAWAFHNIPILIQLFFLVLFVFVPFFQGISFIGFTIFLKEENVETVSEGKCPTESFNSSEYNSAGKMPN
jgi:hypothetical protein